MKMKNVSADTLAGVVTLLKPSCPDLTATSLVQAIRDFEPDSPETRIGQTPQFVDKHRAAQLLGVSHFTVIRLCKEGQLNAAKVRNQWRIPLRAIEALASL
jgi:excisionase family DNA binding protein